MDVVTRILVGVIALIFSGAIALVWKSFNTRIYDIKNTCVLMGFIIAEYGGEQ